MSGVLAGDAGDAGRRTDGVGLPELHPQTPVNPASRASPVRPALLTPVTIPYRHRHGAGTPPGSMGTRAS